MPLITAVLLAAGESRRMGELKALLPWQGQSLLAHQVSELAAAGVDRIMVVLGHRHEELSPELEAQPRVEWVVNHDYLQGKTTSIKAGLGALSHLPETLILLNVDQPRHADTIAYLVRQHRAGQSLITIPTHRGKGGHPIIFDGSLLSELGRISEANQGIREVVHRHGEGVRRVEIDSPEVLWDLNTPEQYHAVFEK